MTFGFDDRTTFCGLVAPKDSGHSDLAKVRCASCASRLGGDGSGEIGGGPPGSAGGKIPVAGRTGKRNMVREHLCEPLACLGSGNGVRPDNRPERPSRHELAITQVGSWFHSH
jgi:hypothetical protein